MMHGGPRVRVFPWPVRRNYDVREKRAVVELLDREIERAGQWYMAARKSRPIAPSSRDIGPAALQTP